MNHRITGRPFILPLTMALMALGACDDVTEIEAHPEVEGFALHEGTTVLYTYMLDDGAASPLGLEPRPHEVVFVMLDHDGEPLPEEPHTDGEEELVLEVTIEDETVLTWTPEQQAGAHTFVEFHGELNALVDGGTTTMTVCVLHGSHCDFEVDVPVAVTADQPGG